MVALFDTLRNEMLFRLPHDRCQVQVQPGFNHDANHTESATAKTERILRPGRNDPGIKERRQGIQPVGQRQQPAHRGLGDGVIRGSRPVIFPDGLTDFSGLLVVRRIFFPHHTLERGEFTDHPRHQIGLAQQRRTLARRHQFRKLGGLSQGTRQRDHPLSLVVQGTQFLVKHDSIQARHTIGQFRLAILVEKIPGVCQTGSQDPLIADPDQLHVPHLHVDGGEKPGQQSPFPIDDREKPLMLFHGGNQYFRGHGQVRPVKRPAQHVGAFQ